MDRYSATVKESSRELTPREKVRFKDEKVHTPLKNAMRQEVRDAGGIVIDVAGYAVISVHNPYSKENADYEYFVVEDKNGDTYSTGSKSFMESFLSIWEEMKDYMEEFKIKVYGADSKNYDTGFLTCSII